MTPATDLGPAPATARPAVPVAERIVEAAAALIAAQGLRGTSVDDIAAAAGCGRATVYRWFPGGRSELLDVTLGLGVDRIFAACVASAERSTSLAEAAAATINVAVVELANDAVVQQLLVDSPDEIATLISPMRIEPLLVRAATHGAEHFAAFADPALGAWVGEWCARVVTDHMRSPAPVVDLTDPEVARRFVDAILVPTLPESTVNPS